MNSRIVVTLRYNGLQRDMEMPDELPLRKLCAQLLGLLKEADARYFDSMDEIVLAADGLPMLEGSATLRAYGIGSGMYLDVVGVRKGEFETEKQ